MHTSGPGAQCGPRAPCLQADALRQVLIDLLYHARPTLSCLVQVKPSTASATDDSSDMMEK